MRIIILAQLSIHKTPMSFNKLLDFVLTSAVKSDRLMLILKAMVSYAIVVVSIADHENLILAPKSSPLDFSGTRWQINFRCFLVAFSWQTRSYSPFDLSSRSVADKVLLTFRLISLTFQKQIPPYPEGIRGPFKGLFKEHSLLKKGRLNFRPNFRVSLEIILGNTSLLKYSSL